MTPRSVVSRGLARAFGVVYRWPPWIRPIVVGAAAGVVGLGIGIFNFIVALPYVVVQMLRGRMTTSPGDWHRAGEMAVLYIGGFTLAGAVYSLIGRQLRRIPRIGDYAAVSVSLFPCLIVLVRAADHDHGLPLFAPLARGDVVLAVLLSLLFGGIVVYGARRGRRAQTAAPSA